MNKKTCIIISGPTAIGKTSYAIELAHKYNTQIISADSRQCYRELNIGVAKPYEENLKNIHHYFINSHSIHENVNAKVFEQYALHAAEEIFEHNDVAIMVGGTGLYIKAFCEGLDEMPAIKENIRAEVTNGYKNNGLFWLRNEIEAKDPFYFSTGEIENPQRMIRALEIKLSTGKSILDFQSGKKLTRDFAVKKINMEMSKDELYKKINKRVDDMMNAGLLGEVESLSSFKNLNALQTVGYKELFDFIEGKISLKDAVDDIKKHTRQFAKRQITWFQKYG